MKIISEWKKRPRTKTLSVNGLTFNKPIRSGCKRVMAVVLNEKTRKLVTKHLDIQK